MILQISRILLHHETSSYSMVFYHMEAGWWRLGWTGKRICFWWSCWESWENKLMRFTFFPIPSMGLLYIPMYGIFTYFMVNVRKDSIHEWYGICSMYIEFVFWLILLFFCGFDPKGIHHRFPPPFGRIWFGFFSIFSRHRTCKSCMNGLFFNCKNVWINIFHTWSLWDSWCYFDLHTETVFGPGQGSQKVVV